MRISVLTLLFVAASCAHETSQAPAPTAAVAPAIAARIGDQTITLADVDDSAKSEIYEARTQALQQLIDERVIADAAKKAGKPAASFVDQLAMQRVPPISSDEAKAFFEANKERMPDELKGKSFAEISPIIVRGLTEQRRQEMARTILGELRDAAHVQVLLSPPKIDVAATGPARGAPTAKVTIVEFSDFQCPFCARAQPAVQEVLQKYDGKVRVVFRDFPLSFHGDAAKAAEAGHCADEQKQFWPLHDWMFAHQKDLGVDELKNAAAQLGMDKDRFASCLDSGRYADAVSANQRDGEKAGVTGTPAFFINGAPLKGAQPFEQFRQVIDRALAQ